MKQVTKVKYQHQKKKETRLGEVFLTPGLLTPDYCRVQARVLYYVQPVPLGSQPTVP